MRLPMYLALMIQSFNNSLAYRLSYYTSLVRELFFLYMSVLLWRALYATGAPVSEASLGQVLTYIGMSRVLGAARTVDLRPLLEARIISGDIGSDLTRPYDFPSYVLFRSAGTAACNVLMKSLPILIIATVAWGARLPTDPAVFLPVVVSGLLAYGVSFQIDFMTGLLSFWTTEMWSFNVIKTATVTLLSGALIPLWFYPPTLGLIVRYLPFSAIVYAPASIYVGKGAWAPLIAHQILWLIILTVLGRIVWRLAVVKLAVQGG